MDFGHIVLLAGYVLNFLLIVFILFFEQNTPSTRFAWLLLVSFIPIAGPILYILFSGNFFTRTSRMLKATRKANEHYRKILENQSRELDQLMETGKNRAIDEYGSIIHLNLTYGKSPVLAHNEVCLLKTGEEKYDTLLADIARATESIHLSYFIINNDETGKRLIAALAKKAREGVTIRLLYDHVGSILTSRRLFRPLEKAGGKVSRFFPVSPLTPFSLNYRNHRKIVVIDGRIGYFGGMNIGDEYANLNGARKYFWRDTHIRVTGSAVQMLQKQFLVDWYTSNVSDETTLENMVSRRFFPAPAETGANTQIQLPANSVTLDVSMQIVTAGPDDARNDEIRDAMIHMITTAKKSVYIESPYFTPDIAFFTALKLAAVSGIDVRVIVPGDWDKWYARLAAMPYIGELLGYGVRFFAYPGFIHSKMLVIDGFIATIGSTNMDTRSFSLHFELNAFFYSEEFGKRCAEMYDDDERASRAITTEWFSRVSVLRKAIWNFFRLFAPLM
jgi:cardiolipin synthase